MGDVLLVACGGGANSALSKADIPISPMMAISRENGTISIDDKELIRKGMANYRVVIPFCILGGQVSTDIVREVIRCARAEGCKVVSVLGIPLEMEADRRERALRNLSDVVALSDCCLAFDMQRSMDVFMETYVDRKFDFFFMMIDRLIVTSINAIKDCLDGPFFTVFKDKLYAFASCNDVLTVNAVVKAWNLMLFDNNTEKDGLVILVSALTSSAEMDAIRDRAVRELGIMPEVMRRTDSDDSKVIVFRSVSSF